jgi:hypothetical protein
LREGDRRTEAVTACAHQADPDMAYQIIDAVMARAIQADAARAHPLFAWIIMRVAAVHTEKILSDSDLLSVAIAAFCATMYTVAAMIARAHG